MTEEDAAEYQAAHASFHHYDAFRWKPLAACTVASAILWGFLFSGVTLPSSPLISITGSLVALLVACALYLDHHFRQLFMSKLYRIHEIEHKYDMRLNLPHGFMGRQSPRNDRTYPNFGPRGHNIDIAVFAVISLFGPVVSSLERGFDGLFLYPLGIVIFVAVHVTINEARMRKHYNNMNPYETRSQA